MQLAPNNQVPVPTQSSGQQKKESNNTSVEFMLQEYSFLREQYLSYRHEGVSRLNFFITFTSAILGGVALLASSGGLSIRTLELVFLVALILLASVGFDVFQYTITRVISSDRTLRGMNRIRRYFVDSNKALEPYIVHPIDDNPTTLTINTRTVGIRRTVLTVLSFTIGISSAIIADLLGLQLTSSYTVGSIGFLCNFIALEFYARRRLLAARKKALSEAHFSKTSHLVLGKKMYGNTKASNDDTSLLASLLDGSNNSSKTRIVK